ncbi:MAG: glycosyltransferase family 39 protein [Acidobacteriota bacterium]
MNRNDPGRPRLDPRLVRDLSVPATGDDPLPDASPWLHGLAGWLVPLALALLFALLAAPQLDRYNVTWDEALGDFFYGERYLSFVLSGGDARYIDFASDVHPYPPERVPDLSGSYFRKRPWEYYPFANTFAAATAGVTARTFGWFDVFDGYHAANLGFAALLIVVLYRFVGRAYGASAALVAIGLLFTAPRIVCHMMANIKDFPLMALFTWALVAWLRAYERGSVRGLLLAGVVLGLSLATKANTLFLPFIVGGVIAVDLVRSRLDGRRDVPEAWQGRLGALVGATIAWGLTGVATMVALWPYLWADPIGRFGEHIRYIGFRAKDMAPGSAADALEAVALTTPPVFLVLVAVGLVPTLRRLLAGERVARLLVIWTLVVIGRLYLPGAINFDGVRHFLELVPALAAIAGLGAVALARWIARRLPDGRAADAPPKPGARTAAQRRTAAIVLGLLLVPGAWVTVASHPFQIAYWNVLAGGLPGAYADRQPQAGDYWGMSYRLGLEWLAENAERDALLAVPVVEHAVRLVAQTRLRDDITLLPLTTPYHPRIAPERLEWMRRDSLRRPTYLMFVPRWDWGNALMHDAAAHLEPLRVWSYEGAPVLAIYRYQPPPDWQPDPRIPDPPSG